MPKKKDEDAGPKPITIHTCVITLPQAQKLRALLTERGWKFDARPYTLYFAQKDRLTVAVYEKGPKCVVQGRGTQEFVQFTLEPEVLGEARFGHLGYPDTGVLAALGRVDMRFGEDLKKRSFADAGQSDNSCLHSVAVLI